MTKLHNEIIINASVEKVFDFMLEPTNILEI